MKHLGDICKINGAAVPAVDCIIGGSPCQDLSVAGKRAGIAGARSGLFMEQVRITKEMRKRDADAGRTDQFIRPRYLVWENVPGAFSSNKGKDFAAVLEEIIRIVEPQAPCVEVPEKGWPTWGGYRDVGGRWSVAWRVLDAQYWGVPQRRRRIALIADFGGASAPEILFNPGGVHGNPPTCKAAREGASTGAGSDAESPIWCLQGNGIDRADTAGCNGKGFRADISYTLNTVDRPAVFAGFSAKAGAKAGGVGFEQETGPTISALRHDASVFCKTSRPRNAQDGCKYEERSVANTLTGYDTGESRANELIAQTIVYREIKFGEFREDDCRNGTENPTTNGTLQAKSTGGSSLNLQNVARVNKTVRRLTPMEYERLQGFPDGWTDIGAWTDSKGKHHKESSDSARYRALGNSIALPPWKWVLKRLCANYERDVTMASLFDGIGGFPLIWEQLNGKGSCLWASEIEEFPIAVTKHRFTQEGKA